MSEELHDTHALWPRAAIMETGDEPAAAANAPASVLIVHDEAAPAERWSAALAAEGVAPRLHAGAPEDVDGVHAVVLHVRARLPDRLSVLREWRALDAQRPLMVVAHELRDIDQVLALEMGADDVLDSRVSAAVVAARLRALWRRIGPGADGAPQHLHFGRLSLHLRERRVQLGDERVQLTECEFEVLWLLAMQAGRAVSRAELLERVRGLPYQRIDRSIDCRVYRIRAKLRDGVGASQRIRTVRNCGYLFSPERW